MPTARSNLFCWGGFTHATDYEVGSEVVRHTEVVEDARPATDDARAAELDGPTTTYRATSSVNIDYDANDLEVPAFLRKRGDG